MSILNFGNANKLNTCYFKIGALSLCEQKRIALSYLRNGPLEVIILQGDFFVYTKRCRAYIGGLMTECAAALVIIGGNRKAVAKIYNTDN